MWLDAGLMKILLSYAMLLLTTDPTFIPYRLREYKRDEFVNANLAYIHHTSSQLTSCEP